MPLFLWVPWELRIALPVEVNILQEELGGDASNWPGGRVGRPGIESANSLVLRHAAIHTTAYLSRNGIGSQLNHAWVSISPMCVVNTLP
jgi:hypothetical protein